MRADRQTRRSQYFALLLGQVRRKSKVDRLDQIRLKIATKWCVCIFSANVRLNPRCILNVDSFFMIAYVKSRPHQQQCRSNVRLCCQKRQQFRTSSYRFDIVAVFGKNVERVFREISFFRKIAHVQFVSTYQKNDI